MDYQISKVKKFRDHRGDLIVFLAAKDLSARRRVFGQIYFITFDGKGVVRGNHYHKEWREWFGIVTGAVRVTLEDMRTGEKKSLVLSADHRYFNRLEIGPYVAHAFKSLTPVAALLNYGDEQWSANDRYEHCVTKGKRHA